MKTQTVSPHRWRSFFRDFSLNHAGALVTMSVTDPDIGLEYEVVNQPLRGISEDGDEIYIHISDGSEHPHIGHRVEHVEEIQLQQTDEGADAAMDITSIDGTRTSIRFCSPALSELRDPGVE
jgi:hypothetical protein